MTLSAIFAYKDRMLAKARRLHKNRDYFEAREILREYVQDWESYGWKPHGKVLKRLSKLERICKRK